MRYALVYGLMSGLVLGALFLAIILFAQGTMFASVWFGYLVMLIALVFVFVGVKRYRDIECGGVVRFLPALLLGLAIALVAALIYILTWEAYLAATHYSFIDRYFPADGGPEVDAMRASSASCSIAPGRPSSKSLRPDCWWRWFRRGCCAIRKSSRRGR
jgi:hypothetical protein